MVIADLDFALITKRKRMMDSVGHYARPELLRLSINDDPAVSRQPLASSEQKSAESPAFTPSSGESYESEHD